MFRVFDYILKTVKKKKIQSLKFANEINKTTLNSMKKIQNDNLMSFLIYQLGSLWTFYKTCEAFNASMPGASRPVYLPLLIEGIH